MNKYTQLNNYFNEKKKSYIIGFVLSLVLTFLSFLCVKSQYFSEKINFIIIIFSALIQIIVHFIYFLHLNNVSLNIWYLISLFFVLIIICIIFFGSVWIMYNLNHHILSVV